MLCYVLTPLVLAFVFLFRSTYTSTKGVVTVHYYYDYRDLDESRYFALDKCNCVSSSSFDVGGKCRIWYVDEATKETTFKEEEIGKKFLFYKEWPWSNISSGCNGHFNVTKFARLNYRDYSNIQHTTRFSGYVYKQVPWWGRFASTRHGGDTASYYLVYDRNNCSGDILFARYSRDFSSITWGDSVCPFDECMALEEFYSMPESQYPPPAFNDMEAGRYGEVEYSGVRLVGSVRKTCGKRPPVDDWPRFDAILFAILFPIFLLLVLCLCVSIVCCWVGVLVVRRWKRQKGLTDNTIEEEEIGLEESSVSKRRVEKEVREEEDHQSIDSKLSKSEDFRHHTASKTKLTNTPTFAPPPCQDQEHTYVRSLDNEDLFCQQCGHCIKSDLYLYIRRQDTEKEPPRSVLLKPPRTLERLQMVVRGCFDNEQLELNKTSFMREVNGELYPISSDVDVEMLEKDDIVVVCS